MLNESRLRRVCDLSEVGCFFITPIKANEDDPYPSHWKLSWPMPKLKQHALIDASTGEVTEFNQLLGSTLHSVEVAKFLKMIDRRINYLKDYHREKAKREIEQGHADEQNSHVVATVGS